MREFCDLILGAASVYTMDADLPVIPDGGIAVSGNTIAAVSCFDELTRSYEAKRTLFYENSVLMPGLINAHTHQTLTRGLHEGLPLMDWLEQVCIPIESNYTREDMRAAALMTQAEFIRGGITTFADLFRFVDVSAEVACESGLRCLLAPQFFDATQDRFESIGKTVDLIRRYHRAHDNRIQVWFGPHAPYSCSPGSYERIADLSRQLDTGIHTHLCETKDECSMIGDAYGTGPVQYLKQAGVLDVPCILAHGIYLSDEDIELLAAKRDCIGIVYNPISNMKLASGVAPIPKLLASGIPVALGTDSNLSNNALDLFNEMRIGSYLQRLHQMDASLMPCGEMLHMATMGGAKVLHLEDQIGSLEKGKRADAIVIGFDSPHLWPVYWSTPSNVVEQVVYAAKSSDVRTTMVDGRLLMEDGKVLTIDQQALFEFVQERAASLYRRSFPGRCTE